MEVFTAIIACAVENLSIFAYMKHSTGVPRCECGGMIKPDVVLYEEGLDNDTIEESVRAISQATGTYHRWNFSGSLSGGRTNRLLPW